MDNNDIRWKQRFNNFSKALSQLQRFIDKGNLNELEEQGLIQAFEYNFELSWNLIKDYYEYQGITEIQGSRDAFRLAFNRGLIKDGENWMEMINSRIKTSHTYNEDTASEIADAVLNTYFNLFTELHKTMEKMIKGQKGLFK
ncbi:MAG: nucleotidyltransferase substrate binding protein [Daejeonella sp.]